MTAAFHAGQQVRLTRGDEALNGEVLGNEYIEVGWEAAPSGEWVRRGFEIAVVESPTSALPTETGTVIRWEKQHYTALAILEKPNQWLFEDQNYMNDSMLMQIGGAPFTALGSLKDHTEVIAKWLESLGHSWAINTAAPAIRREFGEASE